MKIVFSFFAFILCVNAFSAAQMKPVSPLRRFHRRGRNLLNFPVPKIAPQLNEHKFRIVEWDNGYKQEFLTDYLKWRDEYFRLKNMLFGYSGDVSAYVLIEALKKHIQGLADNWQNFNKKVQFKWQVEIVSLEFSWRELSGVQIEALETVGEWNVAHRKWKNEWRNLNSFFSYQFKKEVEDLFILFYEIPTASLEEKFMLLEESLSAWEMKWREHIDIWMEQWQLILEDLAQRITTEMESFQQKKESEKVADEILKQLKNEKIEKSDEMESKEPSGAADKTTSDAEDSDELSF